MACIKLVQLGMEMLNSCQKISIFAKDGFAGFGKKKERGPPRARGGKGGVVYSVTVS